MVSSGARRAWTSSIALSEPDIERKRKLLAARQQARGEERDTQERFRDALVVAIESDVAAERVRIYEMEGGFINTLCIMFSTIYIYIMR